MLKIDVHREFFNINFSKSVAMVCFYGSLAHLTLNFAAPDVATVAALYRLVDGRSVSSATAHIPATALR